MRLFYEVAKRAFGRNATYRGATFAGVFTNTIFGFVKASILLAVYRQRPDVGGFDAVDAVTFTFVTQGMLNVVGAFAGHLELADRIQTGDVVTDIYRPIDIQLWWLAQDFGRAAFQTTIRGCVPFLVGALVFHLRLPSSLLLWLAFFVSLALAIVLSFAHRFIVSLTTFWTLDYRGPSQVAAVVTMFMSGFVVPLTFFPHNLEVVARWLPYSAMVEVPVEIFLGKFQGAELVWILASQVAWAIALLAVGRIVLAAATRRLVVQGG